MRLLNAAAISEDLFLSAEGTIGQIKSIHHDYINILTSDGIVTLVRSGMDHIPFGIEVDLVDGWLNFELKQQMVRYFADAIVIGENLAVRGLQTCSRFSCQVSYDSLTGAVDFLPRLRRLQQLCNDADKGGGILAYVGQYDAKMFCSRSKIPSLIDARIPQAVKMLIAGILENKGSLINEGICGLLGVGPGSTPSGDDFLLGFLSGIIHVQPENCQQAAKKMAQHLVVNAPQLTTFMSVEYIKYGVKGLYHQRVGEMIRSFGAGAEQEMIDKVRQLMQLGHFSGVDFLVGFVYGGFTALSAGTPPKRKESVNENS
ncbi:hypothetical protein SPSIL_034070 [Sporomusa silvacetica DSM 10669]|uniref:DUF2877 domain-containing protein n=1 Tax=Sporomusa silvacetica DSM 10669 TaxID=1123289 RepID=A0ABZ3IPB8_9FIRM|nr:DUF2877 domain-containing protein [Sporomusa silvacetica]OZC14705.1 hypothetical protein SPSIL_45410 [Sporomusa silvacetica DSM 10669]